MCVAMNLAHVARCVTIGTRCVARVARVARGEVRGARDALRDAWRVIPLGYSTV